MEVQVFRLTSDAMNATVYDEMQERLNEWLTQHKNVAIISTSQSTHTRPDTDNTLLVDFVMTVFYAKS